jgi:hypothetical protein
MPQFPTTNPKTTMKKTTTTIIAALVAAVTALNAQARIGETYEQAVQHYGPYTDFWTDGESDLYKFDKGPYRVSVQFNDKWKIVAVTYLKRDDQGAWIEIDPKEVLTLLQNNKQKGWDYQGKDDSGDKVWINGEHLIAFYGPMHDVTGTFFYRLSIFTREHVERVNKRIDAPAAEALEGM